MDDFDIYKTIEQPSEGYFKDKGSKFLAFAYPIFSEEEFKKNLQTIKKKYHDACHHVYAFRIGADKKKYRASDDGEPANSSGQPILGQIQSHNLSNIMIVVVRYFGGTKLGIPGLINAYRSAANDAISNAKIYTGTEKIIIQIDFQYPAMNAIMHIIKKNNLKIIKQDFQLECSINVEVRKRDVDKIIEVVNNTRKTKVKVV